MTAPSKVVTAPVPKDDDVVESAAVASGSSRRAEESPPPVVSRGDDVAAGVTSQEGAEPVEVEYKSGEEAEDAQALRKEEREAGIVEGGEKAPTPDSLEAGEKGDEAVDETPPPVEELPQAPDMESGDTWGEKLESGQSEDAVMDQRQQASRDEVGATTLGSAESADTDVKESHQSKAVRGGKVLGPSVRGGRALPPHFTAGRRKIKEPAEEGSQQDGCASTGEKTAPPPAGPDRHHENTAPVGAKKESKSAATTTTTSSSSSTSTANREARLPLRTSVEGRRVLGPRMRTGGKASSTSGRAGKSGASAAPSKRRGAKSSEVGEKGVAEVKATAPTEAPPAPQDREQPMADVQADRTRSATTLQDRARELAVADHHRSHTDSRVLSGGAVVVQTFELPEIGDLDVHLSFSGGSAPRSHAPTLAVAREGRGLPHIYNFAFLYSFCCPA